jgi:hypothetical protein
MFLSLSSVEGSNGGSQNMITSTPRHSLIIIGNCPYVGGGGHGFCPARLHCSLEVVVVPCHKHVVNHSCPSLIPRWLQESKGQ